MENELKKSNEELQGRKKLNFKRASGGLMEPTIVPEFFKSKMALTL